MTTVIFNAQIQPTSDSKSFIFHGGIEVRENKITRVFSGERERRKTHEDVSLFNAQGKLVIPGLFNAHTHLAMTLFKGVGENIDLMDWLYKYIFPLEAKWVSREFVALGTRLALLESIRSGVTSVADMYYFSLEVADAVAESGLRGWISQPSVGFKIPDAENLDEIFKNAEKLIKKYQGHSRITPTAGPHATYTSDMSQLKRAADFIRDHRLFAHIHVAESESEQKLVAEKYNGMTSVQVLHKAGFADIPMSWAHGIWFTEEDYKLMRDFDHVGVVHNPECNMKLGSGVCPLKRLKAEGIPFGLGTDGSASNNNLDLLSEMDTAVKLQRIHLKDPTAFPTYEAFRTATLGGAEVFRAQKDIGTIEVGKKADLAFIDLEQPHLQPCHDVLAMIVFCARAGDVSDLMVDGQWVMRNRKIETLNEYEILQEAKVWGERIRAG